MDIKPINQDKLVIKGVSVNQLLREYNVQDVSTINLRQVARGVNQIAVNRTVQQPKNPYEGKINQAISADPELYKSALGTPVVINLEFKSVTYTDLKTKQVKTTDDIVLDTVLCTVAQAKKIVKTEIQGADGTVKEYIGMDDYQVTINGIIVGENRRAPVNEVLALKRMLDAPVAIPVVSSFLNNLGIFSVVVNDYAVPQVAGGISKQDFTINAISDTPIELQIT